MISLLAAAAALFPKLVFLHISRVAVAATLSPKLISVHDFAAALSIFLPVFGVDIIM